MVVGGCYGDISTARQCTKTWTLLVATGMLGLANIGDLLELVLVIRSLHEHGMPDLPFLLPRMALESAPHGLQSILEGAVSIVPKE